MKKTLIITGIIVFAITLGLYIYSQGGYQDIHIAKGEHLDEAEEKTVKELVNMEFEEQIWEQDQSLQGNFISKAWHRWNYRYPYKKFYSNEEDIYWGHVRYDFLRNSVIELYKTSKTEYDKVMEQFNHITLDKSMEIIANYYNDNRLNKIQEDITSEKVYPYWIQLSGYGGFSGYELQFLIRIDDQIYRAHSRDGLKIDYMYRSSLSAY